MHVRSTGLRTRARALSVLLAVSPMYQGAQQHTDSTVRTPAAGSATRTAILDAVRAKAGVRSRFKVSHVRANDRWAFIRCVEVVADGAQLQETDLDVAALLERKVTGGVGRWQVVEMWTLSGEDDRPYVGFARRVRERVRTAGVPSSLFPEGFLTSDVPVE